MTIPFERVLDQVAMAAMTDSFERVLDQVAMASLANQSINDASFSHKESIPTATTYRVKETCIVNQRQTGTCWIQAGLAFLSTQAKGKGYDIRFSSCYLHYFDKIEKTLSFIKAITNPQMDERTRWHWMQDPIQEGGTWPMFVHLVKTYGVVPYDAMLPSYQADHTSQLNQALNRYLRSCADELISEKLSSETVVSRVKQAVLRCFQKPPQICSLQMHPHNLVFEDTPQNLCDLIQNSWDFVVLTHAPDRDFARYHGPYFNNSEDVQQDKFEVVPPDMIKASAIAQLEAGMPVWFTADVRIDFSAKMGVAACGLHDVEALLGLGPLDGGTEKKRERIVSSNTAPVHAMLFTGVELDKDRQPRSWRAQNSWGKAGKHGNGFVTIKADWFDENVFAVAVMSRFVRGIRPTGDLIPTTPWDVFGTVA